MNAHKSKVPFVHMGQHLCQVQAQWGHGWKPKGPWANDVNLEVMVQMAWYDMIHLTQERTKWGIWRGANTHTPPLNYREASLKAKIVEHAFDALQGELATMQTTPCEAELECNTVCEQLCKMKIKIEVLEHDIAYK